MSHISPERARELISTPQPNENDPSWDYTRVSPRDTDMMEAAEDMARTIIGQGERIDRVRQAVINPGNHPAYHRQQIDRLRTEWPTLYWAVMALIEDD